MSSNLHSHGSIDSANDEWFRIDGARNCSFSARVLFNHTAGPRPVSAGGLFARCVQAGAASERHTIVTENELNSSSGRPAARTVRTETRNVGSRPARIERGRAETSSESRSRSKEQRSTTVGVPGVYFYKSPIYIQKTLQNFYIFVFYSSDCIIFQQYFF